MERLTDSAEGAGSAKIAARERAEPRRMDAAEWHGPGASAGKRRRFRWSGLLWALVFPRGGQRIVPTVPGVVLMALSLGIGTAAYNSANNILFITLSLLLACLLLSGLLSWLNVRRVAWKLQLSPPFRVQQEAAVALELRNRKRLLPTYGLWFELAVVAPAAELTLAETSGAKKPRKRAVREILAAAEKARLPLTLFQRERLDPRGELRIETTFRPARRGVQQVAIESVGSLFPFGFLRKHLGSDVRREIVVWPAPVEYRRFGVLAARPHATGERLARAGGGGDLFALRKFETGDSHRLMHWKASARTRQWLVRQFAAESQEGFALWLETPADVWSHAEQFELLIGFAGTLAEDLFRAGTLRRVGLNEAPLRPVRRLYELETFLDELAVLQPTSRGAAASDAAGGGGRARGAKRKDLITFAPDGARGVVALVDGEKTAAA